MITLRSWAFWGRVSALGAGFGISLRGSRSIRLEYVLRYALTQTYSGTERIASVDVLAQNPKPYAHIGHRGFQLMGFRRSGHSDLGLRKGPLASWLFQGFLSGPL